MKQVNSKLALGLRILSGTVLLGLGLVRFGAIRVLADTLESSSYVIQFGNFNVTSGEKSNSNYAVTDTVGQTGAGPYGQLGSSTYFVGSGFQYIYPFDQFQFVISDLDINLGQLAPLAHNTDTNTITITAPTTGGYQVYAYEQHPLKLTNGTATIADTTCDNGDCDETTATVWQDTDIGGFGFNIAGDDAASDFVDTTYFRQFANNATAEPMQVIMSNNGYTTNSSATITYKAGLFGSEASGTYQTAIIFVAVPSY